MNVEVLALTSNWALPAASLGQGHVSTLLFLTRLGACEAALPFPAKQHPSANSRTSRLQKRSLKEAKSSFSLKMLLSSTLLPSEARAVEVLVSVEAPICAIVQVPTDYAGFRVLYRCHALLAVMGCSQPIKGAVSMLLSECCWGRLCGDPINRPRQKEVAGPRRKDLLRKWAIDGCLAPVNVIAGVFREFLE